MNYPDILNKTTLFFSFIDNFALITGCKFQQSKSIPNGLPDQIIHRYLPQSLLPDVSHDSLKIIIGIIGLIDIRVSILL